jgi:hypothetical protein
VSDYRLADEEMKMKCLMCIGARCSWVVSKTSVTVFKSIIDAKYILSSFRCSSGEVFKSNTNRGVDRILAAYTRI